ncbi:DNA cytosine methyltransferase [Streptomyces sp. PpalLS-921]|uniref:DNA cytosine methyltransferase n=1 Tax=Streptomyces sp. PpalLS-921 TaxID=1839772 RepID=UPI00081D428F|nr:DNA (cytosine-5-)-methyltransferase [Streptomyces sp. PpalLS-921]SCE32234.1 DNA (cytosine-5)-methyltransferase 1 [Streptomyces sp. PpalLS-921]
MDSSDRDLTVIEICAGAGGQALGLEKAGFEHLAAVEIDENAANTLELNRRWDVKRGDVADPRTWNPKSPEYKGLALLAGGVPCPPFSIAGKQLGATDERDLFAWAVELAGQMEPRALLLENVRGLSAPRFSAYRQHMKDRLEDLGYWSDWRLLHAADFGVPQLRPRFVLVALRDEDVPWFRWPAEERTNKTVGSALRKLMGSNGWPGADAWAAKANDIAPTIVGGSKKHGGADLGPTRAKRAWGELGVDGMGVWDEAPGPDFPVDGKPRLTTKMVEILQGWDPSEGYHWRFSGRKTSRYRQIGNAFPPPVARAVGTSIRMALRHEGVKRDRDAVETEVLHDSLYRALRGVDGFASAAELQKVAGQKMALEDFERRIAHLSRDFVIEHKEQGDARVYRLAGFKGFVGQEDHERHVKFAELRTKIS